MTLKAGAEVERAQHEQAAWQILRRKQGYVTHRVYQDSNEPQRRLVYSEWESAKAVDGARQHLQGLPLMRRARATLTAAPQRLVVELVGPITSTKGLDLSPDAEAVCALGRLSAVPDDWRVREEQLSKLIAAQPGYVTAVVFRGFTDALVVGSFSHWANAAAAATAGAEIARATGGDPLVTPVQCVRYRIVRD